MAICWSGSSHLHLLRQNPAVLVILLPHLCMDVLFGVIHSRTRLENLLSVIVTHSSVLLINVPRYTSSSLAFATNATDHINVVFRKFAYSLMSRVIASLNSIVTAIINSDAYHQSPLMDKWESMLYV